MDLELGNSMRYSVSISKWKAIVAEYEQPHFWHASWQIVNSIGAYIALWCLMYVSLSASLWLTIILVIPAAGLLVRIFIIFHDCVHGSFFKSRRTNMFWGFVTGMLTFTPYTFWRQAHLYHHATSGKLEGRGVGDIWTLTVEEYLQAPRSKKLFYRFVRHPLILFIVGPIFQFLIIQRFPNKGAKLKEKQSVWIMNIALVGFAAMLISIFGTLPWAFIQLSILTVSSSIGVWLFYVQHQFEDAYWVQKKDWNHIEASLRGSSFYKLPVVLQWFTGNIGYHHIHHLSPRIPNYNLELCHNSNPEFAQVKTLTLFSSLKLSNLRLWDENTQQLISFSKLKRLNRPQ
jgi:omega-6 fatty acid desaturase (delta-12 desaturase)